MKTLITVAMITLMSGLAGASDFADLQRLNTSDIPKVNPFPNPGNPDSCYLTGLKDGLCNFKCRSGETFQVKPVKPEASSVYAKCGGGDYRGADKQQAVISQQQQYALQAAASLRKELKYYDIKAKVGLLNETPAEYGLWVEFKNWSDYEQVKDLFYQDPGENPSYMDLKVYPRVPKSLKSAGMNMNIMIPLQRAKMAANTLRTIALALRDGSDAPPAEYADGVMEVSEAVSEGLMDIDAAIRAGDSLEIRHQAVLMEPHIARLAKLSDAIEDSVNYFIWHGPRVLDVATQLKRDMNEVRINASFAF